MRVRRGLQHGNRRDVTLHRERAQHPELVDAIDRFTRPLIYQPTVTRQTFRSLCRDALDREEVRHGLVTSATLRRLMDGAHYAHRLDQPFKTRQSKNVPNAGKQGTWHETEPFRVLKADATPLDVKCVDQFGDPIKRVHMVVVIDAASRKALAMDFYADTFTSINIRRLLVRMTLGWALPEHSPSLLPFLPDTLSFPSTETLPLGTIGVDRGPQFVSQDTLEACRRVGIDVSVAPPGRGDVKGIIESFLRTVGLKSQAFLGYQGADQYARGKQGRNTARLTLPGLAAHFWEWVDRGYHQTLHPALLLPDSRVPV